MCRDRSGRERWLSTSTVARRLGVSPLTVRNMIEAGRFQLWKDGKIRLSDLADKSGEQLTIKELKG